MQTTTQVHADLPDAVVELAGAPEPQRTSASTTLLSSSASATLGTLTTETPTASVGNIEHIVLDLEAVSTTPGIAGLEGVLPSSHLQWLDRAMNIVIASIVLIVTSPLLVIIAIAVKLTSKGPVFYTQPRIGLNRRGASRESDRRKDPRRHLWADFLAQHDDHRTRDLGGDVFRLYKFRSMCEDAESATGVVWAQQRDPRTTAIGAFLRKYRLDELPQFINVLKGDMNIVGPRPERPSIFAKMANVIDEYPLRQRAKPGITGLAQIKLFYDTCIDDVRKKVQYDLEYLRQKSLAKDLQIMASTLPAMLFKRRGW
jgi:lipopolysaccharide/colanic/teichoic acid biosynthesis glycosyltransferase